MLRLRIITALVLATLILAGLFFLPPLGFKLFTGFIVILAAWEWSGLADLTGLARLSFSFIVLLMLLAVGLSLATAPPGLPVPGFLLPSLAWWLLALALVAVYPAASGYWSSTPVILLIGALALVSAWAGFVLLREAPGHPYPLCLLLFLVWGADTGAYFFGKAYGKAKLLPRVSPGKSWAGVKGGMGTALAVALALSLWQGQLAAAAIPGFLAFCALVVAASILGDLCVSMLKRQQSLKDSGKLLPGHGGILDRIDSLLAATPLFALGVVQASVVS